MPYIINIWNPLPLKYIYIFGRILKVTEVLCSAQPLSQQPITIWKIWDPQRLHSFMVTSIQDVFKLLYRGGSPLLVQNLLVCFNSSSWSQHWDRFLERCLLSAPSSSGHECSWLLVCINFCSICGHLESTSVAEDMYSWMPTAYQGKGVPRSLKYMLKTRRERPILMRVHMPVPRGTRSDVSHAPLGSPSPSLSPCFLSNYRYCQDDREPTAACCPEIF